MTLALKYRPHTWADLVGQDTTVRVLTAMLQKNRTHPFYIFAGPRGVGKTSVARILAKTLNCLDLSGPDPCLVCSACKAIARDSCPDVVELDAASHGGVASVRKIRDIGLYKPIQVSNRVVILDEAHAMTREAFQALLKILEEPPDYMTFVMATTEQHAIPDTILSRAFPFEFRRISASEITGRLAYIAKQEKLNITEKALATIAAHVSGGMRDAITVMEQVCSVDSQVDEDAVIEVLGVLSRHEIADLIDLIINNERAKVYLWTHEKRQKGLEASIILTNLLQYTRDLMAASTAFRGDLSEPEFQRARQQARSLGPSRMVTLANKFMELEAHMGQSPVPLSTLLDIGLSTLVMSQQTTS